MGHVLRCSGYELVKRDMVRGQGCYLYDARGRRYVDFESGVWCTALGHNHERVNRAMRAQMERIAHLAYRYTSDLVEAAAGAVLGTLPLSEGKCVFLSSGSEAVEFGVQVARRLTGQPLLLTLVDAYLAAYGSAGRKSPEEWHCFDWSVCAGCPHLDECDPECDYLREVPFERIGGFVFEPGNTSGLVRFPPRGLVQTLGRMVRRRQGLVVVDEVTTGMGRTGTWYGFEHYGLGPDVVALGKGLGNGYPVSAVAMTRDVAQRLEESGFHYAQSHQNDPMGCAVAREVVGVIWEQGLIERSERVGASFLQKLRCVAARYDGVREVRGRGLMVAMELEGDLAAISVYHELLERGFIVGCKPAANLLRFYPPLTIGEEDVGELVTALEEELTQRRKERKDKGRRDEGTKCV